MIYAVGLELASGHRISDALASPTTWRDMGDIGPTCGQPVWKRALKATKAANVE